MRTALLKYLLLTIAFMFLSSGVLVAAFLDAYGSLSYGIFWLLLPLTLIFISAVIVNDLLISSLLLRSQLGRYCISVFGIVYLLTILSLVIEYATRRLLDLPMRINDYSSPWILADTVGNSLLLAMILLGLGLFHLFNRWQKEAETEADLAAKLQSYISSVKDRLNPMLIFSKLNSIVADKNATSNSIDKGIRSLSVYLREQLYELPEPPKIGNAKVEDMVNSRTATLLVAKKYRSGRHLTFLGTLGIISCGAFFTTPDQPVFTFNRFLGVLSMFTFLTAIAYCNILWLYPRFMKRGNIKKYAVAVITLLLAVVAPLILLQVLTYEPNVYTKPLPVLIAVISTLGSMLTLFLFIGGVSAVLLLQNWIETKQRLTMLSAETIRQEYSYLRKQINPHFLFNVLNNIGVSVYDNLHYAKGLIIDLIALLRYQLEDLDHQTTTLSKELSFIKSYFALETTRRETFDYYIATDNVEENAAIPTLLFIPFIENAVKFSSPNSGIPEVSVCFSMEGDRLRFECRNSFDADSFNNVEHGGIGIANTRRRLDLLFEDRYSLVCENTEMAYKVILEIPLK